MGPRAWRPWVSWKEVGLFLWTVRPCPDGTWHGLSAGAGEQVGEGSVDRETGQEAIVVGPRGQEHPGGNPGGKQVPKEAVVWR